MLSTKTKKNIFYIELKPNKSSTLMQNIIFFGVLSLICITFGIGFLVAGAPLILPFAGFEIFVLIVIIKLNRDWSNQLQILEIEKLHVKITTNNKKKTYDRFLSKFLVQGNKQAKRIFFQSQNIKLEIGGFLTIEEKEELANILKRKVNELNFS